MKKRQIEPDFLKGVCISLMVYGHITYIGHMTSQQEYLDNFIYTFHMPIFLLVSGFLFSFTNDVKAKALKVVRRIVVPYIFFISLYLIGLILVEQIGIPTSNQPPITFIDFIETVILNPYGGYWFLHSLFIIQLSILFASYITFTQKNKNVILILILSLVILVFWSQLKIVSIRTSIYFLLGLFLGIATKRKLSMPILPPLFAGLTIMLLGSFDTIGIYGVFSKYEVTWCLVLFAFLWATSHKYQNTLAVKLLAWIGRNSLSILVLHALFIVSMKTINKVFLYIDSTGLLYSVFVTFSTISLCLFSSYIFDKIGLSKFLFGVPNILSRLNLTKKVRLCEERTTI